MESGHHPLETLPRAGVPPFYNLPWEQRLVGVIELVAFMAVWAALMWVLWPWTGPWIKKIKLTRDLMGGVHLSFESSKSDKPPDTRTGE